MKKLNLANLQVESFTTSSNPALRGTVVAHSDTGDPAACQPTYHDPECDTGTGPAPTFGFTCGQQDTCVKGGGSQCGTCDQPSCIPGTGCGGTTDGVWQC